MQQSIERIIANFEVLDDWADRYRYIIDLGRQLPGLPSDCRVECNRVDGCVSKVWLVEEMDAGSVGDLMEAVARSAGEALPVAGDSRCPMYFNADSDAHIVRGLIAILLHLYCGKTPEEILALDPAPLFTQLGLDKHLSVSRSNGLNAMVKRLKQLAAEQIARRGENTADSAAAAPAQ
ncbi:MAG: SufE family protein [Myxococcales bacterium]|nr:SufE family protein [Myxococcales bacterium]